MGETFNAYAPTGAVSNDSWSRLACAGVHAAFPQGNTRCSPVAGPAGERVGLVVADVAHGPPRVDRITAIEHARVPPRPLAPPILRCDDRVRFLPRPPGVRPQLATRIRPVLDELDILAVRDRRDVDAKRRQLDDVARPLVVVRRAPVVRPDRPRATGKPHHRPDGDADRRFRDTDGTRRAIRLATLELQRLKDRLVVLVLVLRDETILQTLQLDRKSVV